MVAFNLPDRIYAAWVDQADKFGVSTGQFARAAAILVVANLPETEAALRESLETYQTHFRTRRGGA